MKLMMSTVVSVIVLSFFGASATLAGTTWHVSTTGTDSNPGTQAEPYATIQHAIDSSSTVNGDVIQLEAGTYFEGAVVDTLGKAITILGVANANGTPLSIIDGANTHRVLQCNSNESATTVFDEPGDPRTEMLRVRGLTTPAAGCTTATLSSPSLDNCTFESNSASYGGGMFNQGSSPSLDNCTMSNNNATVGGGGMYNYLSSPSLDNCTFENNFARYDGGGMYSKYSSPTLDRLHVRRATRPRPTAAGCTTTIRQQPEPGPTARSPTTRPSTTAAGCTTTIPARR